MTRMVSYFATAAATVLLATTAAACGKASTPAVSGPTSSPSPTAAASPSISAPASTASPTSTLQAQLSEFKIVLPTTTFTPGQETFAFTNVGSVTHELLVFRPDIAPEQFPLTAEGVINEDAPNMHLLSDGDDVDPGKSQTRTVDLGAAGTYVFVCNLPGHFKAGMFTVVTVK